MKIIKLIKENDKINAQFDCHLNFIEGENSAGYPTIIAVLPWMAFSPKGYDEEINKIFSEMVELWNEKQQKGQFHNVTRR